MSVCRPKRVSLLAQCVLVASIVIIAMYGLGSVVLAKTPADGSHKKTLDGAQLYDTNCNRCHSERYPTEHTPGEWKTLMIHMRVRANLPPEQAKAILKYLQENAGK
jgi:mono/diheme cytochrome c family protein